MKARRGPGRCHGLNRDRWPVGRLRVPPAGQSFALWGSAGLRPHPRQAAPREPGRGSRAPEAGPRIASRARCAATRAVTPSERTTAHSSFMICLPVSASSCPVGSSAISSSVPLTSALAIATRCCLNGREARQAGPRRPRRRRREVRAKPPGHGRTCVSRPASRPAATRQARLRRARPPRTRLPRVLVSRVHQRRLVASSPALLRLVAADLAVRPDADAVRLRLEPDPVTDAERLDNGRAG